MKVKIIKSSKPEAWYSDKIGEEREVKIGFSRASGFWRKLIHGIHLEDVKLSYPGCGYMILFRDCKIIW